MDKKIEKNDEDRLKLAELDQIYSVSLELLEKTKNPSELLDALLDEYARRLAEIPGTRLVSDLESYDDSLHREKVRALMMFAQQAALLKENADMQVSLKDSNERLAEMGRKQRRINKRLRQLNAHYLDMLGFVSHELRSPLISVLGFAELLEEGFLGELNVEQKNSVQIIIRVTRNLIDMIRNYLDLAKIENGELVINWQQVDLAKQIVEPILNELQGQLVTKGMRIKHKPPESLDHVEVDGDPDLLKVVFMNVFSNAIKYGRPGTTIYYNFIDLVDHFYFSVLNEGKGVPENTLQKIFDKFSQGVNVDPDLPRGTGLGLFNTRCIVESHSGTIWAESAENKWFKLCMTFPKHAEAKERNIHMPQTTKSNLPTSGEILQS